MSMFFSTIRYSSVKPSTKKAWSIQQVILTCALKTKSLSEVNHHLSDYQIKTDCQIGHEAKWCDVREVIGLIHDCLLKEDKIDWSRLGIKVSIVERPNNYKGDEILVELPNKEFISDVNNNTDKFLVLISKDDQTVIMPEYYKYLAKKIEENRTSIGNET